MDGSTGGGWFFAPKNVVNSATQAAYPQQGLA
jgi:hypothetical protein